MFYKPVNISYKTKFSFKLVKYLKRFKKNVEPNNNMTNALIVAE